jgi:hypothetical protein
LRSIPGNVPQCEKPGLKPLAVRKPYQQTIDFSTQRLGSKHKTLSQTWIKELDGRSSQKFIWWKPKENRREPPSDKTSSNPGLLSISTNGLEEPEASPKASFHTRVCSDRVKYHPGGYIPILHIIVTGSNEFFSQFSDVASLSSLPRGIKY